MRLPVAPLNGGVSTQPYDSRLDNQFKSADNVILKIQRGLEKRPGTHHVAALDWAHDLTLNTNMFTHFFSYGDEDYVLLIDDDECDTTPANDLSTLVMTGKGLQIFNLSDGSKETINVADATRWVDVSAYLRATASTASRDKLKAITYGNTTIVVNTKVPTAVEGTVSRTTGYVETELSVPPEYNAGPSGHPPHDGAKFHSIGDIIHLISGQVGYPTGYYEVIALADDDGSGLDVDNLDGPWYERLEANASGNTISPDLMPFKIVRTSAGVFEIDTIDWNKRLSGDTATNPSPAFIGETIKDICIFQDRLWIGSETALVASQAGDLFNFWVDDYTNVTDSDPITLTMPGPEANQVQWLIPMNDRILVFGSQSTQHEVTTRDIFSPSSTNLQTTTGYRSSDLVRPKLAGQQILFTENKPNHGALWEYFYDFGSDSNLAIEATIQCQEYLPTDIFYQTVDQNQGMAFMAAKDSSDIYIYHYHWDVNQKLQSAFARWRMYNYTGVDCKIIGLSVRRTKLYIIHQRLGKIWLEYVDIQVPNAESPLDFGVTMDAKQTLTGVYDSGTNLTTYTLTGKADNELDETAYRVVLRSWGDKAGQTIKPVGVEVDGSDTLITLQGRYDANDAVVGVLYEMSCELSQPIVRDQQNQAVQGNFQIRTMEVRHEDTTSYEVEVTPKNRDTKTFAYNSSRIGSSVIGVLNRSDYGRFNVRVFGNSQDTSIVLKNASPYPVLLTKLEYIGDFVPQRTNPVK